MKVSKFTKIILAPLAAITLINATVVTTAHARGAPESFADLAEKLLPAVVNISTVQKKQVKNKPQNVPQFPPGSPFEDFFKDFFDRNQIPQEHSAPAASLGSGFIIDAKEGLVVTNNHVIAGADEIKVVLQDDTNLAAELIGVDKKTDLALLKIDNPDKVQLSEVTFGDSDKMRVGDWVLAIGNPFGLGGTVTSGIISARARDINSGPYDDYLQTDASINRGNSGGPMFNMDGDVIGVNTAIFSPTGGSVGIGFAIPSNMASNVIYQLKEYGETRRGWLGVRIQYVSEDIAEGLGLKEAKGALIASVTEGGPADEAGLESGDVVLTFNGQEIEEMRNLPRIVAETKVGAEVPLTVWREGKVVKLTAVIGQLETAEETGALGGPKKMSETEAETIQSLGLKLAEISDDLRAQYNLSSSLNGVLVLEVEKGSTSAKRDVRVGDVIVEVSQTPITNPKDVALKVEEARDEDKRSILLLIDRQGDTLWVALSLDG